MDCLSGCNWDRPWERPGPVVGAPGTGSRFTRDWPGTHPVPALVSPGPAVIYTRMVCVLWLMQILLSADMLPCYLLIVDGRDTSSLGLLKVNRGLFTEEPSASERISSIFWRRFQGVRLSFNEGKRNVKPSRIKKTLPEWLNMNNLFEPNMFACYFEKAILSAT